MRRVVNALVARELKQDRAERVDVRSPVDLVGVPRRLLRGHVRRGSHRDALEALFLALEQAREAEVEDLHHGLRLDRREEDVVRFEIAMHDAVLVRGLEHGQHTIGEAKELGFVERRPLRALGERLSLEKLHHEVRRVVRLDDVVIEDLHRIRMLDAVRGVPFLEEALADVRHPSRLGRQDLHRRARPVPVTGRIDGAHAANAEKALERPLPVEHGPDPRGHCRVGHSNELCPSADAHTTRTGYYDLAMRLLASSVLAAASVLALLAACSSDSPRSASAEAPLAEPAPDASAASDAGLAKVASQVDAALDADAGDAGPAAVQLIGRFVDDPAGPIAAWPGTRILARFRVPTGDAGTGRLAVKLREIEETWMLDGAPSEWDVTVDGVLAPTHIVTTSNTTSDFTLATGLAAGEHEVELYRRSEAQNGATQLLGFDLGGATLLAPPPRKTRRIEIVGDSAAAGFGILNDGGCPGAEWAAAYENFHLSFGAIAGDLLGAEVMGSVYSGKGMAKNIYRPDTDTMPLLYPRASPTDTATSWDFARYASDAMVIIIGGNDFAIGQGSDEPPATLDEFAAAYDGFVTYARTKNPATHIFMVTSPSISDDNPPGRFTRTNVKAGIARVLASHSADAKLYALEPTSATVDQLTACDGHGNEAWHRLLAKDVATAVTAKLGW